MTKQERSPKLSPMEHFHPRFVSVFRTAQPPAST